jgi:Flp pilus assembly protein TadD
MPREKSVDVAHEQVTDHRIQRPSASSPRQAASGETDLTLVGGGHASDRDLGLAYFEFAKHGDQESGHKAMSLLQQTERKSGAQADPELHTALGVLAQFSGDRQMAMHEYETALRTKPADSAAAGDLAILEARTGDTKGAITLLQGVSQNDPGETTASMDLAMVECAIGNAQAATMALQHLLEFSPDDGKARQALAAIQSKPETCRH